MKYFDKILLHLVTAFIGFAVCFFIFDNNFFSFSYQQKTSSKDHSLKSPKNNEIHKEEDNSDKIFEFYNNMHRNLKEIEIRLGRIEEKLLSPIEVRQSTDNNLIDRSTLLSGRVNSDIPVFEDALDDDSEGLILPSWVEKLPLDKQEAVNYIFQENADMARSELSFLSDGDKENPQILDTVMEECDKILKEKLRSVLNDEEFKSFIDSLPESTPDYFSGETNGDNPLYEGALYDDSDNSMIPSWITKLPLETQAVVNHIFQDHVEMVSEELFLLSDNDKMDTQIIENITGDYDKILKEKLRSVLSEKEFQSFLDSLPEPTPDFEKP